MKSKILSILALLCITASSAWAQTTADIGRVIAADGKMYKTVTLANKVSTASGVVVYVGSTSGCVDSDYPDDRVLVLAVNRTGYQAWGSTGCTHGGAHNTVASAVAHMNGNSTTLVLYNEHISTSTGHHTHLPAYQCRTLNVAKPSGSHEWFWPTAGQWNLMVKGLTGSSANLSETEQSALTQDKLNVKIQAAGAEAISGNQILSTSSSGDNFWEYANGRLYNVSKTYAFSFRAMFTMPASATNGYVVEYDANNGSGAPSAQSKTHGAALALSSTVPTREGYTFDGWATSADGAVAYAAGASYTNNADVVLYAHWTQNTASLTDGDDLSALSTYAGKTCTVTYLRSFTAGKPSTVCLPFAYTPKSGETFYTFTGINEDDGNYTADMTEVVSPLVANTPYLFMPTGDADFSGTYAIPDPLTAGETTSNGWTFKGTYSTIEWTSAPTEHIYGFSAQDANDGITQGQFVKVGSYVRIKPMRAYLEYNGSDSQFTNARSLTRAAATTSDDTLPETIGVRLISANGEVTAIGTLYPRTGEVSFDSEAWYTLDGKRLNAKPNTKGIYVNNGKKVVIK